MDISHKMCYGCGKGGTAMEKIKRIAIFIGTWVAATCVVLILGVILAPTSPEGDKILGGGFTTAVFIIPVIIAILVVNKDKIKAKLPEKKPTALNLTDTAERTEEFVPPASAAKQQQLADKLVSDMRTTLSFCEDAPSLNLFVHWYDQAIADLVKMVSLVKANFNFDPTYRLKTLRDEYQLHLCDAIVRIKEETLSEIDGKYKNSREFQEKALTEFCDDIGFVRSRFSPGTADVADKAISDIEKHLGINQHPEETSAHLSLWDNIDFMDGHRFEYWCADVLRKIGFCNVEVTRGSGDQGVDVLAEKDGVKYAIQCKCYTSDLGNKPVQEVNTGKTIYRCQVGVVMTNRYFTQGAKDAAEATGILLWDRDVVQKMAELANMA
jgi:restriction system protein